MMRALLVAFVVALTGCAGAVVQHETPVMHPRPATLTGELYRPAGSGPFPAVILLHGCGGIVPAVTAWAEWLRAEGYAALVLDSFGGRGLTRLCGDTSALNGFRRSADPFAATASVARLPFIDAERIAAMGFSHGGWTILWSAQLEDAQAGPKPKAYVALYPFCGDIVGAFPGTSPVLMLLGALDDWTPAAPCQRVAAAARQGGRDVVDVTYPNAHHGFDSALVQRPITIRDARRGMGATVAYDPAAHADAEKQVRAFLRRHLSR